MIDIERLTDLDYWNEVAPEGATHALTEDNEVYWEKWEDGVILAKSKDGWREHTLTIRAFYFRLEKPTPPTWNGRPPPVGTVCEALYDTYQATWHKARIVGKDGHYVIGRWLEGPSNGRLFEYANPQSFRPIRTPEQIQRDELRSLIEDAYMSKPRGHDGGLDAVAEAVLDKYTLEPKA